MDEDYKQSEISKEVERLMDEEGFEFGEAVKEAMSKGYKDGGLMIAIQKLAKGGMTYGTTDAIGVEPEDNPVTIPHWATTIYHQMGINADKELMAPGDRPIEIVDFGEVIQEIIA